MRKHFVATLALVVVLTTMLAVTRSAVTAQVRDKADAAFKSAMDKETVDGDLRGAIEQYKKLAQGQDRAIAAKALVRLGLCYEKQGSAEARKAYERVTREFADQPEAAQQARARLAAAGTLTASGKTTRQVWAGPEVGGDVVSPDGRSIIFSRNGNVMLRELATGSERLVARGAGCPDLSPDGRRLAVCLNHETEIGVVNVDGTGLRTVYRHTNGNNAWPEGWSSDGSRILAQEEIETGHKHFWVGATDGAVQPIPTRKSFGAAFPSPDGKYLAYAGVAGPNDDENVYVMALDGTGETNLSAPTVDEHLIGWTKDGTYLLTYRHLPVTLWAIPMSGGKAQGRAVQVHDFGGDFINSLGITRAGALYYGIPTNSSDIFTASMDPSTGKVTSAPLAVPLSRSGHNVLPRWAPDSRQILYAWTSASINEMSIYSFATGKEQRVARQVPSRFAYCWSRDGASILLNRTDAEVPSGMEAVRFNVSTGETTRLFPGASPFVLRSCTEGLAGAFDQSGIKVRSLQNGSEKEIYKFGQDPAHPGIVLPVFSHGGRAVAFIQNDGTSSRLRVVPSDGGAVRELASASSPAEFQVFWGVAWSPDDRFVYFAKRADNKSPYELFRIPAAGGTAESAGLKAEELRDLDIAPDGTHIAFSIGVVNRPEVWVMENFLPKPVAGR
jgi:Tol biopolymer transport system component